MEGRQNDTKEAELNVVVVHVQDESKSAQCDFLCDRELLVREMGYFKDYLVRDGEFIPEVEILVHCDIKVFEWLMRYVKRRLDPKSYQDCWLSVSNVLALLISSDFLKMEELSYKCLVYFCEHINAIIASPCSLGCLNDSLVQRIADQLSIVDLEKIKDRKDKIKSKLFFRKIEQLFDPDFSTLECPENASSLFQCASCDRILTQQTAIYAPCLPWRRVVNRSGHLIPVHQPLPDWSDCARTAIVNSFTRSTAIRRASSCFGSSPGAVGFLSPRLHDPTQVPGEETPGSKSVTHSRTPSSLSASLPSRMPSTSNVPSGIHSPAGMLFVSGRGSDKSGYFSATDLLAQWFRDLGNWRLVYWRLWATVNLQNCRRCERTFPIIELGDGCFYHPQKPVPLIKTHETVGTAASGPSSVLPASSKSCKAWHRSNTEVSTDREVLLNRSDHQSTPIPAELVYPCCGLRRFRFDPFEIPSGCHRNQHMLKFTSENGANLVDRFTIQHQDIIGSWAPKRSFNPNNAPGLMALGGFSMINLTADHLRLQEELIRKTPVCITLPCLEPTKDPKSIMGALEEISNGMAHIGDQWVSLINEIPGGFTTRGTNSRSVDNSVTNDKVRGVMSPNGLISSTLHDLAWDSMKCYRSNQDSQRQDDLRRMQRFAEFLYAQRASDGNTLDRVDPRQFSGGIYSRLEAQWRVQNNVAGPTKSVTHHGSKKSKPVSVQSTPFR